jgi:ABC-type nitrate/sulfonate/bicarbonate transport system substrate-binding protein/outer membrane protein OmpA-like peptidoglycan-associated protein
MKKSFWIGLVVLIAIIGAAVAWRFLTPQGAVATPGSTSAVPNTDKLPAARVEPLRITGIGGYSLSSVNLGEGSVPLLRIPLDTWGGYAALFAANRGTAPNRESVFYKRHKFAVEIVSEESAQAQADGFAAGRWPVIWYSMDGLPLLYDALKADKRVVPQVIGLFDWSVGGDGILVRDFVRKPQDLKGKTILTSSPAPYSFFLLWYLAQIDVNPLEVKVVHVDDGPKALKTFKDNAGIAAWVTWTPFLTDAVEQGNPGYVPGTRLLITSKDANQLIADVFVARNDFVRERPEIARGLVAGIIEGGDILAQDPGPAFAAMAAFYKLEGGSPEAKSMLDEVHLANLPESAMFFDSTNPIGAHKLFYLSQEYYKLLGVLSSDASYEADRVIDASGLAFAQKSGLYSRQKNTIQDSFNRGAALDINDLESQRTVLATDIRLYFEAQKLDFDPEADTPDIKNNMRLLGKVAEQTKFLGTTVVKLVGHLDTTRTEEFRKQGAQAFVEASAQAKLISKRRAEFVKSLLVSRFGVETDRVITEGRGWDQPVDAQDPSANRRVEVIFLSFE